MAIAVRKTSPAMSDAQRPRDYLAAPLRAGLILGAFFLLAVPLCILRVRKPGRRTDVLSASYMVALGFTHFALTWVLYLRFANRKYFLSSRRNTVLYFVMPAVLMIGFAAAGFLDKQGLAGEESRAPRRFSPYGLGLSILLKAADYYHVARQSFGVLQMFKSKGQHPRWQRSAENGFFLGMALLQLHAFVRDLPDRPLSEGQRGWLRRSTLALSSLAGLAFSTISASLVRTIMRSPRGARSSALVSFAYFVLQSASSAIVVYRPSLYRYALAMHYVEYHILMAPRCFDGELDLNQPSDRAVAWFRDHRTAFYLALLAISAWIGSDLFLEIYGKKLKREQKLGRLMINATNGIFVSHYLIEALVWRFGNPFYRGQLKPLYLAG
jgi:hypothetical protein